jgi:hypothetical protein
MVVVRAMAVLVVVAAAVAGGVVAAAVALAVAVVMTVVLVVAVAVAGLRLLEEADSEVKCTDTFYLQNVLVPF